MSNFREADFPRPTGKFAIYRDVVTGRLYHFAASANADRKPYVDTVDGLLPARTAMAISGVNVAFVEYRSAADIIVEEDEVAVPDVDTTDTTPKSLQELHRNHTEQFLADQQARHAARRQICDESRPSERQTQLNAMAARQREEISQAWRERRQQ